MKKKDGDTLKRGCPFYEHPILSTTLLTRLCHWTWVYTTGNCKRESVSSLGEPMKDCKTYPNRESMTVGTRNTSADLWKVGVLLGHAQKSWREGNPKKDRLLGHLGGSVG